MEMMKHKSILFSFAAILAALGASAQDPAGLVVYSLPRTVFRLEVEARLEQFHAGPYAKYAEKYLGTEARTADKSSATVSAVTLMPYIEADPGARYGLNISKGQLPAFLQFTSQGLVSLGSKPSGSSWRFPSLAGGDFSDKGVSTNLTYESATLYTGSNSSDRVLSVRQEMVVTKSVEARAKEAADMIFEIRHKRYQIVTGDTDATYSGEAMGAAIEELTRLEKEYLSLFFGYCETSLQKTNYEIVPLRDASPQRYVAFRISDSEGLVSADDISGRPCLLELELTVPAEVEAASDAASRKVDPKKQYIRYMVPATCNVRLTDGVTVLLRTRVPVYQLGTESTFEVNLK